MMSNSGDSSWALAGSVGAALGAALCCLGPVVLVSLGVTGAWIGRLSALEPYRPAFMVAAGVLLGFAFYRVYAPAKRSGAEGAGCHDTEDCDVQRASAATQVAVWVAAVVVLALFGSPYLLNTPSASTAEATGPSQPATTRSALLEVKGMTCGGCVRSVTTALEDLEGVRNAEVTLEPPRAKVTYVPDRVSVRELENATAEVGFESKLLDEHQRDESQ